MLRALAQFLDDHQIRQGRMLIGVSGGADSVALLRGLDEVAEKLELELIVGHFDHALRPNSAADAQWVESLCRSLNIPCCLNRNPHVAGSAEVTPEEAARDLRYDFFKRTATEKQCRWLALGHTADDQAETIFHHLIRGSGLKGLSGIPPLRSIDQDVMLIRPLLQVHRTEILGYLQSLDQPYRIDPTNENRGYTRNKLRHEILPLIRAEMNPRMDDALFRLAQQATEVQTAIEFLAKQLLAQALLERQPHSIRLQRNLLENCPVALLRELFSQVWQEQGWPRKELSFAHLNQLAEMAIAASPPRISLPGRIEANCRAHVLELRRQ